MRELLEKRFMTVEEFGRGYPFKMTMGTRVQMLEEANLITSRLEASLDNGERMQSGGSMPQMHYILIDLDHEAELIETSTPGHFHLYVKHAVTEEQLDKLVSVMEEIGMINPGIKRGWEGRGALCLRKPGVVKGVETP